MLAAPSVRTEIKRTLRTERKHKNNKIPVTSQNKMERLTTAEEDFAAGGVWEVDCDKLSFWVAGAHLRSECLEQGCRLLLRVAADADEALQRVDVEFAQLPLAVRRVRTAQ